MLDALPNSVIFSIQQVSIRGTFDIVACINGHFVGMELKASATSKVSGLQRHNLEKITNIGKGYAFLVFPENWDLIYKKLVQLSGDKNE
jgi:hypothetical protein